MNKSEKCAMPQNGFTDHKCPKSLGYWRTPGELNLGEGRGYEYSLLACNISNDTYGSHKMSFFLENLEKNKL